VIIACGIVFSGALVGAGVLLGTRLEDPAPKTGAATAPIVLTPSTAAAPAHTTRGDAVEPARPSAPLVFTANVNDLPRAPATPVYRRGAWPAPPPKVTPPAAPATTPATPPPAASASAAPDPAEAPSAPTPVAAPPAAAAAPPATVDTTPAAPVDPLIREMQKAVDDQGHHN
jgi:hypothetical protein